MSLLRSLFLITAATTALAAHAEGVYVEAGSLLRHYNLGVPGASSTDSSKGYALSGLARLGYAFDEHWAVEAGYVGFGKPSYRYRLGDQDGRLSTGGHATLLAGRGRWPLNDRFALVGRLGLARHQSHVTGSGEATARAVSGSASSLYASLGAEVKFNDHWQLGVAFEHFGKNRDHDGSLLHGLSTTVRYAF